MTPQRKRQRMSGIALVDLSIAMLVGAACLGGFLTMLSVRAETQRAALAEQQIQAARAALVGYAMAHGHLPCPADPAVPSGKPGAGDAAALDGKNLCARGFFGSLPWTTLGLPELDPWHRRLSYRVAMDAVVPPDRCIPPDAAGCFSIRTEDYGSSATRNALIVREVQPADDGTTRTEPIARGVGAVVVSHGPNGALGFGADGTQRAAAHPRDHERDNVDPASTTFFTPTSDRRGRACPPAEHSGCELDDVVAWLTRGELLVALMRAGHAVQ